MKKLVFAFLIVGMASGSSFGAEKKKARAAQAQPAAQTQSTSQGGHEISPNEGSDSCGLGWQVTEKRTMLGTTTRGTTNAFVPPTFGMTSGTIGCEQHQFSKNEQPAVNYAIANYEPLTLEMAQGEGEYLAGFARTLGCADSVVPLFASEMQRNFKQVVVDQDQHAVRMFQAVKEKIEQNAALSSACSTAIL